MNGLMLAGGVLGSACVFGHAVLGARMLYRPMEAAIVDDTLAGVLSAMWQLITICFAASAVVLFYLGAQDQRGAAAWLIAAQFAGCAMVYLVISLRMGGALKLAQWIPFALTAAVTAVAAR